MRLLRTAAWWPLTRRMNSYFNYVKGVNDLRGSFWRGIVAGSILGAAMSVMAGAKQKRERQNILGYSSRQARSRARQMMRSMKKTVSGMIK